LLYNFIRLSITLSSYEILLNYRKKTGILLNFHGNLKAIILLKMLATFSSKILIVKMRKEMNTYLS